MKKDYGIKNPAFDRALADMAYPLDLPTLGKVAAGCSKRELFAAMAMQGRLANPTIFEKHGGAYADVAADAVQWADALLVELAKPHKRVTNAVLTDALAVPVKDTKAK